MANPWFRLYSEFAHDPKVQMLSEVMQRRYVMLMCMRCSYVTLRNAELAFQLRISDAELTETKTLFIAKGFVDNDWNLLNWEKRQFTSDHDPSGAKRQQKFRDKRKQSNVITLRNAPVTLPEQNRTEQIQSKKAQAPFTLPDWINQKHWDAWHSSPKRKKATAAQKQLSVDKLDKWRQADSDFAGALENAAVGGYQGLFLPDAKKAGKFTDDPFGLRTAL